MFMRLRKGLENKEILEMERNIEGDKTFGVIFNEKLVDFLEKHEIKVSEVSEFSNERSFVKMEQDNRGFYFPLNDNKVDFSFALTGAQFLKLRELAN